MKKLSFLLLIFISILKVEGSSYVYLYSNGYSNKANIEYVYSAQQKNENSYFSFNSAQKEFVKNYTSNKNLLTFNKLSLLYFNEYVTNQLKLTEHCFKFFPAFQKIPQVSTCGNSGDEDPLRLN